MILGKPVALFSVPPVSWKNGGGITRTLVSVPEGAGLDDFAWRVSMAEIHAPGPFSVFPQVDRTILLWRGDGAVLHSPQWPPHQLTEPLAPFHFRGEDEVACTLAGGLTEDLNLMVRRNRAYAELCVASAQVVLRKEFSDLLVLCAAGSMRVQAQDVGETRLTEQHMLHISSLDAEVVLVPETTETRFVYIKARLFT